MRPLGLKDSRRQRGGNPGPGRQDSKFNRTHIIVKNPPFTSKKLFRGSDFLQGINLFLSCEPQSPLASLAHGSEGVALLTKTTACESRRVPVSAIEKPKKSTDFDRLPWLHEKEFISPSLPVQRISGRFSRVKMRALDHSTLSRCLRALLASWMLAFASASSSALASDSCACDIQNAASQILTAEVVAPSQGDTKLESSCRAMTHGGISSPVSGAEAVSSHTIAFSFSPHSSRLSLLLVASQATSTSL